MAVEMLGQAFVEIVPDTKGFGSQAEKDIDRELGGTTDKVNSKIGDGMSGAFKKVGAAIAAAGVGAFFKSAIDAATDTAEQVSKVGVVFGDAADSVLEFGDNATESMGASKLEALEATATFGNLLRSVGLSGKAAASMSTDMTQLAGDLASFNNVPVGDALEAIRSGLVGETEPLKKFGVNLNEASLKAEALRLGLDAQGPTLSATAKAQAAYSLIMQQTALAQGDFERTSNSLANQQRILAAEFANAKAEVGEALAPAMLQLVKTGRDLMPVLVSVAGAVGAIGTAAATVIGPLGTLAGSDFGQALITFGVGATAAYVGIQKVNSVIGPMVDWLRAQQAASAATAAANLELAGTNELVAVSSTNLGKAGSKLAEGIGGAVTAVGGFGPIAIAAATAAGIATLAFADWRNKSRELAAQQEEVNKALLDAGDPAQVLAGEYDKISKALTTVEEASAAVSDAKGKDAVATKLLTEALAGQSDAMARSGVTMDTAKAAVLAGGSAFDQLLQTLNKIDPATGGLDEGFYNLSGSLQTVEQDLRDADAAAAGRIKTALEEAAALGLVSEAQIEEAKATSNSKDGNLQWIAAGSALEGQLQKVVVQRAADAEAAKRQAEEQDKSTAAAVAAIDPHARLAQATKDLEQATKDVKGAMDDAKASQDAWLFGTVDFQAELDDTTKSVRDAHDVTKTLTEEQVAAAIAGTDNSEAALKVRSAYQQMTHEAAGAVDAIGKQSATAEEATARTAAYAQQQYDLAIAYGAPESEAARVRDTILSIPQTHTSAIDVHQHGAAVAKAEIDSASEDTTATIHVTLASVGISQQLIDSVHRQLGLAQGAMVRHTPGGTLALIGEGAHDEAVVPMGRNFAANLARIVGPKAMAQLGQAGSSTANTNISVNIANAPGGSAEAQQLGRIVGETAAQVLAHRQLATSVRVG